VDFFLKLLLNLENFKLSSFIFRDLNVFSDLMDMGLPSFDQFLDSCFFQTTSMSVQVRHWKHHKKEYALGESSCSSISDKFLKELIGVTPAEAKARYQEKQDSKNNKNHKQRIEQI